MGCTCSTATRRPWMRGRSRPGIALTTATRNGGFLSSANWTRFPICCWYLCATTRSTFSRRSGSTTRPISMARAWSGRAIWARMKTKSCCATIRTAHRCCWSRISGLPGFPGRNTSTFAAGESRGMDGERRISDGEGGGEEKKAEERHPAPGFEPATEPVALRYVPGDQRQRQGRAGNRNSGRHKQPAGVSEQAEPSRPGLGGVAVYHLHNAPQTEALKAHDSDRQARQRPVKRQEIGRASCRER